MPCVVMLCWYGTISMGCAVLSITLVMVWGDDPCDGMCFGVLCCVVLCCVVLCCVVVQCCMSMLCCVTQCWYGVMQYNTMHAMWCGVSGVV